MKSFKQFLDEKGRCWTGYKPVPGKKPFSKGSCKEEETQVTENKFASTANDVDSNPSKHLGPQATKAHDKKSIGLQKKNLSRLAGEYHKMSKDEGGSGMAKAHGDMFANTKKNIHHEEVVIEDGGAAGVGVVFLLKKSKFICNSLLVLVFVLVLVFH